MKSANRRGTYFLAMEYLSGQTLRERMNSGPLTPGQAQPILAQVGAALDAVHKAGIIHRDIKPSNVMLLPDGTAKLLDFGIARQSDDTTITSTGMLIGSPSYMAPEQALGETSTTASDIWALGVLAYEMLAGQPPFTAPNIPSVLYQIAHQTPPPIPGVTMAVQKVVRHALDRNPARRYPPVSPSARLCGRHRVSLSPRHFRKQCVSRSCLGPFLPRVCGPGPLCCFFCWSVFRQPF